MARAHIKINKNLYCACSGRITNNKEVILTTCAMEYLEKMGYCITKNEQEVIQWLRDKGYLVTNFKIK